MQIRLKGILCALLTLLFLPLTPDTTQASESDIEFTAHGRLRYRHISLDDFPVNATGERHGQEQWGTSLLRIKPELSFGELNKIHTSVQVLDGMFYGEESAIGGDRLLRPWLRPTVADQVKVREAYAQFSVGVGLLRAGRMASHWGLGLIANNGDTEDYAFGDATHGDISDRAMFVTRPLEPFMTGQAAKSLYLVLAIDKVVEDELTSRADGDKATQYIGALRWRAEDLDAGLYVAYRDLIKADGDETQALASDVYVHWKSALSNSMNLDIKFEGVYITGSTEMFAFEGVPDRVDLNQFAWVLRSELDLPKIKLKTGLELGMASGDNSTQDGNSKTFRIDPNYKVGMILFEDVLNRLSARAHDHVQNPELLGTPPEGSELLPTNGSITNAIYINPTVHYTPIEGLNLSLGFLAAFAPADLVDAYVSAQNGGYNYNSFGKNNASGLMGMEVNAGLTYDIPLSELFELRVGGQYGYFLPGSALDAVEDVEGLSNIQKARILADVRW